MPSDIPRNKNGDVVILKVSQHTTSVSTALQTDSGDKFNDF